jgi:Ca2+:H+ antiporter
MAKLEGNPIHTLRREAVLVPVIALGLLAFVFKPDLLQQGSIIALLVAVLLIASIAAVSVRIAHHAELLAAKVGDPYGTMIQALSAVLVEVVILLIISKRVGEAVRLGGPMA